MTHRRKLLNEAFEGKAGTVCALRPRSSPGWGPGCPRVPRLLGGLGEGWGAPGCSWPRDRRSRAVWGPAGIPRDHLISFPNVQFSVIQFFSPLRSSVSENTMFATVVTYVTESAMEKNKQKYTQIAIFLRLEMQGVAYTVQTQFLTNSHLIFGCYFPPDFNSGCQKVIVHVLFF